MPERKHPCSECGKLIPVARKTCGASCRTRRSRRLKKVKQEAGAQSKFAPEVQAMAAAARDEVGDALAEVAREELRPVVREAMTESILGQISRLVTMTPEAIRVLEDQLQSDDEVVRQRAATLILKYTMGNPSVAPVSQEAQPAGLQVVFHVPRPGDTTAQESSDTAPPPHDGTVELPPEDAAPLRECGDCHVLKPEGDFVAGSECCWECFNTRRDKVQARLGKDDPTAP